MTPIETNRRLRVLILISLVERFVKYNETIFGSVGIDLNPFFIQNKLKSLKSDLYALKVFTALEFFKFIKVSSCNAFIFVVTLFIIHIYYY